MLAKYIFVILSMWLLGACAPERVYSPADEWMNAGECQIAGIEGGSIEQGVFRVGGMPVMEFRKISRDVVSVHFASSGVSGSGVARLGASLGSGNLEVAGELGVYRAVSVGDPDCKVVMSCKASRHEWFNFGVISDFLG